MWFSDSYGSFAVLSLLLTTTATHSFLLIRTLHSQTITHCILILGKCKALWGKPRTSSFVASGVRFVKGCLRDGLSCRRFDEKKIEKIKGDRRPTLWYGFFACTSAHARVPLSYEFRL